MLLQNFRTPKSPIRQNKAFNENPFILLVIWLGLSHLDPSLCMRNALFFLTAMLILNQETFILDHVFSGMIQSSRK